MNLLEEIRRKAMANHGKIGLGIGGLSREVIRGAEEACEYAEVVLVGDENKIKGMDTSLEVVPSREPNQTLVDLLLDKKIDGAVRGTLSATKTLSYLKKAFKLEKLYRLALLQTVEGIPFFFAPVGIDEGASLGDKIELIRRGAELIRRFGTEPNLGVLSGGRLEDLGRDPRVDLTLAEGDFIVNRAREMGIEAKHYAILIEDAIRETNFILAPDGITGNLIYRTLVFLGGGLGYGAPVLMEKVFVDTSRAIGQYSRAIMMASALVR